MLTRFMIAVALICGFIAVVDELRALREAAGLIAASHAAKRADRMPGAEVGR